MNLADNIFYLFYSLRANKGCGTTVESRDDSTKYICTKQTANHRYLVWYLQYKANSKP